MRKPYTPRSSQKRTTSIIAALTSGLRQLRSGCTGEKLARKYCCRVSSQAHAEPSFLMLLIAAQLFGGLPSALASRQIYQSALALSRLERDSWNQECLYEV